ncbi:1-aminocyclopropane-1-carboxylate deaminase/D-cysteine desulfhydrase [Flavicella sediminum]|uniref:1-aminocyclopropane-1-carboxylate deaminase/D-cysteine desulfhydrase n=1 Tax=Flavicella sediminum TaxID=2585141 RepID=UPI00112270C4|nr:pyridoxal-phosphate dependent enzyme [Flavicella sediminum]
MRSSSEASKLEPIFLPLLEEKKVSVFIKREDQLHPIISGNKFRKLKYNIGKAQEKGYKQLLTFGGAFSNHILATAGAGKEYGMETIGIIRGEELGVHVEKTLAGNATLRQAAVFGMQFQFISRGDYRLKEIPGFLEKLRKQYPEAYIVPEGGTNDLAIKGCEEILNSDDDKFDVVCCAVGTGGTISGIINSAFVHQKILGFPALKGDFLKDEILKYSPNTKNWDLISEYHFGGYGKVSKELVDFINDFKEANQIPLDPVYTGKMVYGVLDLIEKDYFSEGSKILLIHTGGLQGISGMNSVLKKKALPLLK